MGLLFSHYQEQYRPSQQEAASSQQHYYQTWGSNTSGQSSQSSTTPQNKQSRIMGCLSYGSFWLSGLVFLIYAQQKNDRYVRFHALQSALYFGALFLLTQIVNLAFSAQASIIPAIVIPIINLLTVASWIYALVQAYRGTWVKLPIIGDFVTRYVLGTPSIEQPK